MGHLSILILIKVHYIWNNFTDLEISNFTIFHPKKYVLKICGKVKNLKSPVGFELKTYRLIVKPLTHCASLLGDNYGKETIHKIKLDVIDYI